MSAIRACGRPFLQGLLPAGQASFAASFPSPDGVVNFLGQINFSLLSPEDQDWLVPAPLHHHQAQIVEGHASGRGLFVASVHAEAEESRQVLQEAGQGGPESQGPECQAHFLHCILPHESPCEGWDREHFLHALCQMTPDQLIKTNSLIITFQIYFRKKKIFKCSTSWPHEALTLRAEERMCSILSGPS